MFKKNSKIKQAALTKFKNMIIKFTRNAERERKSNHSRLQNKTKEKKSHQGGPRSNQLEFSKTCKIQWKKALKT